jgi:hypothetical protein
MYEMNHEKDTNLRYYSLGQYKTTLILLNATMMELEIWFI